MSARPGKNTVRSEGSRVRQFGACSHGRRTGRNLLVGKSRCFNFLRGRRGRLYRGSIGASRYRMSSVSKVEPGERSNRKSAKYQGVTMGRTVIKATPTAAKATSVSRTFQFIGTSAICTILSPTRMTFSRAARHMRVWTYRHRLAAASPKNRAPQADERSAPSRERFGRRAMPVQAALVSITLLSAGDAILIWRGFIFSGSSRARSTCRRPFSRVAPLTSTKSASWKTRSNARAAMP